MAEQSDDDSPIPWILKENREANAGDRGGAQATPPGVVRPARPVLVGEGGLALPPGPVQQRLAREKNIRDICIGFVGWWLLDGAVYILVLWYLDSTKTSSVSDGLRILLFLPWFWFGNITPTIILAFIRRWVALGVLTAYASNILVALIGWGFGTAMAAAGVAFMPFYVDWIH